MDFSCDTVKCLECGNKFPYSNGYFVSHLKKEHNISLREYVIKYEYNNDESLVPKCQCGYCDRPSPFYRGKFLEGQKLRAHQNSGWLKEQYIKKYGIPKCQTCGNDIASFNRGKPRKYCDICLKNKRINQNNSEIFNTSEKTRKTMMKKYGVVNSSQFPKNRKMLSKRMKSNNPMKDPVIAKKSSTTFCENVVNGKTNLYKQKKYKDMHLNYQSSFEYDFLKLCESYNILDRISSGNRYPYIKEDKDFGHNILTDFCLDDKFEIEIKSSYILKIQGGMKKLFAKKRAVESRGKGYIFILDKDYSEFIEIMKNI